MFLSLELLFFQPRAAAWPCREFASRARRGWHATCDTHKPNAACPPLREKQACAAALREPAAEQAPFSHPA